MVPKSWLQERMWPPPDQRQGDLFEPVEERESPEEFAQREPDSPLAALFRQMRPGDEVWSYASDARSWEHLAGRAGFALVRRGKIVAQLCTMMN